MRKVNISVLVSGGGTSFQAVIDAIERGDIPCGQIVQVISSTSKAYSLERAKNHGIKAKVIGKENYPDMSDRTDAILAALKEEKTDMIVLAGYMSVLDARLIDAYRDRIINIHPSLIPKYCGKGFYGHHVHEAVLAGGETESGATVHFVDEGVDTGKIILQRTVPVEPGDTPDTLAARVLKVEHTILPLAVKQLTETLMKDK
ncbi:MAG: phosphoribosylglycinamide formyltransferase [Firmicutes bacterium]|nr:phosphoribosylglycinamide formyltransferase [Bacillota bacterium]